MTNKLPPGRAEDRRQVDGFAGDNERRKRFVLGGATTPGTAANSAMKSASQSNTTSSKMGATSTQSGGVSKPSGGAVSSGGFSQTQFGGGQSTGGAGSNTSGSKSNQPSGGFSQSQFGGGGGQSTGGSNSNTSGSRDNGTRGSVGSNAPAGGGQSKPSGGFSQSQFGGGGGGQSRPSGNTTGVGGPGGGGMGLNNARKGSSTSDVGRNSGSEAPGNIGRGVGGGTSPAMAALQDRVDNRALAKSLTSASLLGDTKPRPPTAGRSAVTPTFARTPTVADMKQQYSQYQSVGPAPAPTAAEMAQKLQSAYPDRFGQYSQAEVEGMLGTFAQALPGEADINRYTAGSMRNLARVGLNQIVGGYSPGKMLAGMDTTGLRPATIGMENPSDTSMGMTANWSNPVTAQQSYDTAMRAINDAISMRGVDGIAQNASNFVAAGTRMPPGVNAVGSPIHGTQFGSDPNWGSRISTRNNVAMAQLNTPTQVADAVSNRALTKSDVPALFGGYDGPMTTQDVERQIGQWSNPTQFPNSQPMARPTSVADVFNGIGEGLGSIFGNPTPSEAATRFTPASDPRAYQEAMDQIAREEGSYYVGGYPNERMLYNTSDKTLARMNDVFDRNAPVAARPSGTATPWGGRMLAPAVPGAAGMDFTGIPGTTQPGLYDQIDPFSSGDRGISKPANPYTARKDTERVVGDAITTDSGVSFPGQVFTNIGEKVALPGGFPPSISVPSWQQSSYTGPAAKVPSWQQSTYTGRENVVPSNEQSLYTGRETTVPSNEQSLYTGRETTVPSWQQSGYLGPIENVLSVEDMPEFGPFGPTKPGMSRVSNIFATDPRTLAADLREQITGEYEARRPAAAPPIETSVDVPYTEPAGEDALPPGSNPALVDPHSPQVKYPRMAIRTGLNAVLPGLGWLADKVIGWDMNRINEMTPEQQAAIQARWAQENKAFLSNNMPREGGNENNAYIPPNYYNAFPSALGYGGGGGYASGDGDGDPATPPAGDGTDASSGYRRRRLGMPDPYTYGYSPEHSYFTYE
jgi:hypothetical protein